jgi:transcription initiation factor TFIIIB Brf1 subunit/transcription initiation factor TFIIB
MAAVTAEEYIARFAEALGRPAPTEEEIAQVLRLASVSAHASERRAAPVCCWLAATAGTDLAEARRIAEDLS